METFCIYSLCHVRSREVAVQFLNRFLPNRVAVADEYPFPEFADNPKSVFKDPFDVIELLESDVGETYALYWNNSADDPDLTSPLQAMLFFLNDGKMIVGLAVSSQAPNQILKVVSDFVGADYAMVTGDEPPPEHSEEFKQLCKDGTLPRVVAGVMMT